MTAAKSERLYFKLQMAAQAAHRASDRCLRDTGLTTAQTGVLLIIQAEQPVTQRDVARALRLRESAVTAMVVRLLDLGFIHRLRDEADARRRLLAVSAAGEAALASSQAAMDEVNAQFEACLSASEVELLAELLERVGATFSDVSGSD